MRDEQVVAYGPAFTGAIAFFGFAAVGGAAGGEEPGVIAQNGTAPGLVVRDPVFAFWEGLEGDTGVVLEVERELGAV